MSNEDRINQLNQLMEEFKVFMHKIINTPGSAPQKQQALIRFDEGHLWMQNAVASYVPEPRQPAV